MSDDWNAHWGAYAEATALNPAQDYRRRLIHELLALPAASSPVRLLDLGSGTGALAAEVLRRRPDADVLGLDASSKAVEMARVSVPGARFLERDFTQVVPPTPGYEGWATHAVCSEVLEHLDDPASMLRGIRPYFGAGCRVVVTVPSGPRSAFDRHLGHRRHFSRRELAETLGSAGLTVVDSLAAGFPFFNLYRLAVLARGTALIEDVRGDDAAGLPPSARAAMQLFGLLFRLNLDRSPLGWQLAVVGLAT